MIHPFPPNLQNNQFSPYLQFPEFLHPNECLRLKKLMIGGFSAKVEGDGSGKKDQLIRSTTIFGLGSNKETYWIFKKLQEAVVQSNFAQYGFDLFGFSEVIQISKYNVGDHYDWHMDIGSGILSQRKLSVVIQLTAPSEYEGGELEFFQNGDAPKEIGTMILFPSFMYHRVRMITKGLRHSLVAWISGSPFK